MQRESRQSDVSALPGSYQVTLRHPSGKADRYIELAVFQEHRYSFYYWAKWTRELRNDGDGAPPHLVTIDWHRDLAPPGEKEIESLDEIARTGYDRKVLREFTLNTLDAHNDSHILSAARCNLIGDVILLKNYGSDQSDTWKDYEENIHNILEFRKLKDFTSHLLKTGGTRLYLDIDVDFFVKNKVAPYQVTDVQIYEDREIRSIINPGSPLFGFLFDMISGITIATEPRYCGGVRNSNHVLNVLLDQLFTPAFAWKHLSLSSHH